MSKKRKHIKINGEKIKVQRIPNCPKCKKNYKMELKLTDCSINLWQWICQKCNSRIDHPNIWGQ